MSRKDWKNIGKVYLKRGKEIVYEYDTIDSFVYYHYTYFELTDNPSNDCFEYHLVDEHNLVIPLGVIDNHYSYWKPTIEENRYSWRKPVEYRRDPIPGTKNYSAGGGRRRKLRPYDSRRMGGRVKQKKVNIEEESQ